MFDYVRAADTKTSPVRMAAVLAAALALSACAPSGSERASGLVTIGGANFMPDPPAPVPMAQPIMRRELPRDIKPTTVVYFSTDRAEITPDGQRAIAALARYLRNNPSQFVTVQGHADIRGNHRHNVALAARRAQSVQRTLVAAGVPAARVRTVSLGPERLTRPCSGDACLAHSRRAFVVLDGFTTARR